MGKVRHRLSAGAHKQYLIAIKRYSCRIGSLPLPRSQGATRTDDSRQFEHEDYNQQNMNNTRLRSGLDKTEHAQDEQNNNKGKQHGNSPFVFRCVRPEPDRDLIPHRLTKLRAPARRTR
jgi:hypothetical protein